MCYRCGRRETSQTGEWWLTAILHNYPEVGNVAHTGHPLWGKREDGNPFESSGFRVNNIIQILNDHQIHSRTAAIHFFKILFFCLFLRACFRICFSH